MTQQTTRAAAVRIRSEALALVRMLLDHTHSPDQLEQLALQLDQQIKALVGKPGHKDPDVQRALSDADLDLEFVLSGGQGPSSTEAQQLLRR